MKDLLFSKSFQKTNSKDSLQTSCSSRHFYYRKYNKITYTLRSQFLQLIINGNCSIKKAAEILNINYSSAKSIISEFRKESQKTFKGQSEIDATNECSIREIENKNQSKITLNISIGSSHISQKNLSADIKQAKQSPFYHIVSSFSCCS